MRGIVSPKKWSQKLPCANTGRRCRLGLEKNERKKRTKGNHADEKLLMFLAWKVTINLNTELLASAVL
jgi:hypothetical protein